MNQCDRTTIRKACISDKECGECEFCFIPSGEPICSIGFCNCRNGYVESDEQGCLPVTFLQLDQPCSGGKNEKLPSQSICRNGRVQCNAFTQRIGRTCRRRSLPGMFGSRCLTNLDCLGSGSGQLWCNRDLQKCVCYSHYEKFNPITGRCEPREFNDPCNRHEDCQVFGSLQRGGFTYGGGRCNEQIRRCTCNDSYGQTRFSFIENGSGFLKTKKICVHHSALVNIGIGGTCTLDPIFYGNNPLGRTRVCSASLYCSKCSSDSLVFTNMTALEGICREP